METWSFYCPLITVFRSAMRAGVVRLWQARIAHCLHMLCLRHFVLLACGVRCLPRPVDLRYLGILTKWSARGRSKDAWIITLIYLNQTFIAAGFFFTLKLLDPKVSINCCWGVYKSSSARIEMVVCFFPEATSLATTVLSERNKDEES